MYKGLYFIIALQNNLQCIIIITKEIITETRLQRSDYFREMVILETWLQKNNYRDAIIIKK